VVGDGPDLAAQRDRVAGLGLSDRVTWHGVVPDAGRYFRAFDALCLSSRTEGIPVVLFEAMAAGVPVVATRVGGVGEVLDQESAWLCPPEDPEALRAGVRAALLDADAAREKAAAARSRLQEDYGVESWLDRYETLYRTVSEVGGGGDEGAPAIAEPESAS
ncbi:MAG: glycosyltransferase, partial [Gemmatimonadota bacterium]|nr:glycosyltransferase [Gemmatimonadota bacterium]